MKTIFILNGSNRFISEDKGLKSPTFGLDVSIYVRFEVFPTGTMKNAVF
jgi:hypothetical protein